MQAIVAKYRERIASGWTWMRRSHTGKTLDPVLRNDPAATYVAGTPRVGVRAGVKCGTSINMRYRASITQESVCFMLAWFYVAQVNRSSALQMLWRTGSGTGSHWFGRKDNGLLISGVGAELTGTLRPNSWNSVVLTDQGYSGGTDIFVNGRLESQRASSLFLGSTSVTIDIGDDAFGQPFLEPLAELYFINGRLAHANPSGTPDSTDAMALHKLGPGALSLTQRKPITRVYFDMGAAPATNFTYMTLLGVGA